jgi:hypothetical protein
LISPLHQSCAGATSGFAAADSILLHWRHWGEWSSARIDWSACPARRGQRERALDLLRETDEDTLQRLGPGYEMRADVLIAQAELLLESRRVERAAPPLAECRTLLSAEDPRRKRLGEIDQRLATGSQ